MESFRGTTPTFHWPLLRWPHKRHWSHKRPSAAAKGHRRRRRLRPRINWIMKSLLIDYELFSIQMGKYSHFDRFFIEMNFRRKSNESCFPCVESSAPIRAPSPPTVITRRSKSVLCSLSSSSLIKSSRRCHTEFWKINHFVDEMCLMINSGAAKFSSLLWSIT